ncbi:unnamed protein product [Calypogeia fissa]
MQMETQESRIQTQQLNRSQSAASGQKEAVTRLNLLLTIKESSANIPHNLEARSRLEFFTNSLFMHMPVAPPVWKMLSFSVFVHPLLRRRCDVQ